MNNKRIYIALAGIVFIAAVILVTYPRAAVAPVPSQISAQTTANGTQNSGQSVSLTVQGLYSNKQVSITADQTILSVLQGLNAQDPKLQLTTKVYAGMGTLVTGMGTSVNGTGKNYWQYKVNNVVPQIGADAYVLKNGDSVEWSFGPSQE